MTDPTAVALAFEVTRPYVTDVDRAKAFYVGLGWRMDIDFMPAPGVRIVQMTHRAVKAKDRLTTDPAFGLSSAARCHRISLRCCGCA